MQGNSLGRPLVDFLETLVVYKFPGMSREEIGEMFGTQDLRQTRFYQEVIQEGIQQGLTQGIQREATHLTLWLLRKKVGELPLEQQTQIRALSVEQLEVLGEDLLDFGSLADLTE
ncbi:DUF4351 domain-containing protein [Thermostichus vulcanus]|uniref:DUF4351 domain-containing protein n=1 Tax=Thermostichus vulcanus str. 'Rupite' TaxID=2813851 RepID=A0ABT0C8X5_THEVL|nr:DUF4351 domain-containing protein [Thermostichus vulcanus]MCJ2542224.1 DUF4351 domain-containing protein [Thermostichus vulcanus str. 'Rupite']